MCNSKGLSLCGQNNEKHHLITVFVYENTVDVSKGLNVFYLHNRHKNTEGRQKNVYLASTSPT